MERDELRNEPRVRSAVHLAGSLVWTRGLFRIHFHVDVGTSRQLSCRGRAGPGGNASPKKVRNEVAGHCDVTNRISDKLDCLGSAIGSSCPLALKKGEESQSSNTGRVRSCFKDSY